MKDVSAPLILLLLWPNFMFSLVLQFISLAIGSLFCFAEAGMVIAQVSPLPTCCGMFSEHSPYPLGFTLVDALRSAHKESAAELRELLV